MLASIANSRAAGRAGRRDLDSPGWSGPDTPGRGSRVDVGGARRGADLRRWARRTVARPPFVAGLLVGVVASWAGQLILFGFILPNARQPDADAALPAPALHAQTGLPHAAPPVPPGAFHAIIVPAGGQSEAGPPPHVVARLEKAAQLYALAKAPKPFIITTAWGTPHKVSAAAPNTVGLLGPPKLFVTRLQRIPFLGRPCLQKATDAPPLVHMDAVAHSQACGRVERWWGGGGCWLS